MIPVQQLGHLVFLEFLTVLVQGFGFLLEHGFDPGGKGVHGHHHALKFKGIGLGGGDEPAFAQGIGLDDHRVERA